MDGIQNFNAFTYQTADGENVVATKNNGVVTLSGDKNGVRQMPLEDFKKEFVTSVPQLERTPSADSVELSKNNTEKKEASSGKKWGVGIASAVVPGLGQAINGQWGKAAGFLVGAMASNALAFVSPLIACPVILGVGIGAIVDAVKNAKPE